MLCFLLSKKKKVLDPQAKHKLVLGGGTLVGSRAMRTFV